MLPFCSHCGADLSGRFSAIFGGSDNRCPDCGLDVEDALPPLVETDEEVVYDLHEWEPGQRVTLTLALRDRDIPLRWEPGMVLAVHETDVPAVEQALDDTEDMEPAGWAGSGSGEGGDGEDEGGSEEADIAAQEAMGDLFVAADRLVRDPIQVELLAEVSALAAVVDESSPPFGIDPRAWDEIAKLSKQLAVAADEAESDDEETLEGAVSEAAGALRDFLRPLV